MDEEQELAEVIPKPLVERLQEEADLCRSDGANDIAALLDEAWMALSFFAAAQAKQAPPYVPAAIWLPVDVRGDPPVGHQIVAAAGHHSCESNRWGALSVMTPTGVLGIKPGEYYATRWRKNDS